MRAPADPLVTIDGTALACRGAIAALERAWREAPPGSVARVRVGTLPNRIDLHAWAERNGHRVLSEVAGGPVFDLVIEKGIPPHRGPRPGRPSPA
jgi:TusA-related sulfurtransferase